MARANAKTARFLRCSCGGTYRTPHHAGGRGVLLESVAPSARHLYNVLHPSVTRRSIDGMARDPCQHEGWSTLACRCLPCAPVSLTYRDREESDTSIPLPLDALSGSQRLPLSRDPRSPNRRGAERAERGPPRPAGGGYWNLSGRRYDSGLARQQAGQDQHHLDQPGGASDHKETGQILIDLGA